MPTCRLSLQNTTRGPTSVERAQKYEYRLRKSAKSGTAKFKGNIILPNCGIAVIVIHIYAMFEAKSFGLQVAIDSSAITIERLEEHIHTHDIEEDFRI